MNTTAPCSISLRAAHGIEGSHAALTRFPLALTIISVGCAATRSGGTLSTGITAGDRVLSAFYAWEAGHQVERLSTFRSPAGTKVS